MRCREVQVRLSALADGELSPSEREAVLRHLHACGRCALRYDQLKATSALLDRTALPEQARLVDRVMSRLAAERVESSPAGRRGDLWRGVAAAAAGVLLLLGGYLAVRGSSDQNGAPRLERALSAAQSFLGAMQDLLLDTGKGVTAVPADLAVQAREAFLSARSEGDGFKFLGDLSRQITLTERLSEVSSVVQPIGVFSRLLDIVKPQNPEK